MFNKTFTLYTVIGSSILIITILGLKCLKLSKDYEELYLMNLRKEKHLTFVLKDTGKRRLFEISVNNKKIVPDYNFINRFGNRETLASVIDGKKLVFYFNTKACSTCLKDELNRLAQIDEINKNDILIITDFISLTDFYRLARIIPKEFILLNSSNPLVFMQNNDLPIYFILNKNLSVEKSFIPSQSAQDETQKYLTIVSRYLQKECKTKPL